LDEGLDGDQPRSSRWNPGAKKPATLLGTHRNFTLTPPALGRPSRSALPRGRRAMRAAILKWVYGPKKAVAFAVFAAIRPGGGVKTGNSSGGGLRDKMGSRGGLPPIGFWRGQTVRCFIVKRSGQKFCSFRAGGEGRPGLGVQNVTHHMKVLIFFPRGGRRGGSPVVIAGGAF